MSPRSVDYLLIGGGIASGNCARHLREQGADGSILLVGREPDPPYNRPPLSKKYVRGEETWDDIAFRPQAWYGENDVEVLTRTSVMKLDTSARTATLSNKDEVRFDKALLATGSNVNILHHLDGARLDGIHYLRARKNADDMREELENAERIAVIGGSWIGTELSASFTALGKQVELLMLEEVTHERVFGREVGSFFEGVLTEHGVKVHGNQELEHFEGEDRVRKVVTKSGLEVECDFVVIGAGVHPELHLAKQAGIDTDAGVITDKFLESSVPGVFAAGDIAEHDSVVHGRRLRIEHWDVAFNHGKTAALNMLGKQQPHATVPYFWSDLADWTSLEYVGPASDWDEIWIRGSRDDGKFSAWYIKDGKVAATLAVGRSEDLSAGSRLLEKGIDVSGARARIEDADEDISDLEA